MNHVSKSWDPILHFRGVISYNSIFFGAAHDSVKTSHGSLETPPRSSKLPLDSPTGRSRKPPSEAAEVQLQGFFFCIGRQRLKYDQVCSGIFCYGFYHAKYANLHLPLRANNDLISKIYPSNFFCLVWLVIFVTDSNQGINHHFFHHHFGRIFFRFPFPSKDRTSANLRFRRDEHSETRYRT